KTDLAATITRPTLRQALAADAAVSGANGVAYLAAAGPLADLLGIEAGVLRAVGAFLVVFAVAVALVARRSWCGAASGMGAANGVLAAASIVVAIAAVGSPRPAGIVWIVLSAIVVALFAELRLGVLRRGRAAR